MEEEKTYDLPELPTLDRDHGLKIQPYPYQLEGIARGLQFKRFINGDDMGLGKTLQAIATVNLAGAFPCLVVCPNVVKINWQREWHKFTDRKAAILTDSIRDTWPFFWKTGMDQVFIANYESLKKYFVRRINKSERWTLKDVVFHDTINLFKSVIIDESHKLKSITTQQSKFCKGIASGKEYIIMLTGTPVVNRPKDLISQLGIMNRINDLGGWKTFVNRYCSGPNEASNLRELNYQLWSHCFFRREKSKVLTQLPDKIRTVVTCEITNRKEYEDAERDLIDYLRRYKEADDAKIQKSLKGEVMVRIGILKDITARGKLKDVTDFVNDFRENGKKIILFCNLHEIVDRLLIAFPHAVCVTGRQTQEEKQASIDAFQKNPKTDIIICSIKAASAGITLTAASDVAFIELPWTYADCDQAESRAHRIGQKDSVNCYYLLGRQSIDQKLYRIIEEKKKISNAILGAEDNIETNIVDMMASLFDKESEI
jgi:SWI/SNF-related matrix-associated actin-dependent regulator 1 of chromatin subfamily A